MCLIYLVSHFTLFPLTRSHCSIGVWANAPPFKYLLYSLQQDSHLKDNETLSMYHILSKFLLPVYRIQPIYLSPVGRVNGSDPNVQTPIFKSKKNVYNMST